MFITTNIRAIYSRRFVQTGYDEEKERQVRGWNGFLSHIKAIILTSITHV